MEELKMEQVFRVLEITAGEDLGAKNDSKSGILQGRGYGKLWLRLYLFEQSPPGQTMLVVTNIQIYYILRGYVIS